MCDNHIPAKIFKMAGMEDQKCHELQAHETDQGCNGDIPKASKRKLNDVESSVEVTKVPKRSGYLQWDDYFMAVAFLSAQRSKDPNSQVGACIVNEEKKIVGIGYNGMPNKCSDDLLPWAREADDHLDTKYPYVCHAEMNAILNKNSSDVKDCTMYVALFPCNECAKLIIQSGITKVVYLSDKYHNLPNMKASRKLLDMAKVEYVKFEPQKKSILVDFSSIEKPLQSSPARLKKC